MVPFANGGAPMPYGGGQSFVGVSPYGLASSAAPTPMSGVAGGGVAGGAAAVAGGGAGAAMGLASPFAGYNPAGGAQQQQEMLQRYYQQQQQQQEREREQHLRQRALFGGGGPATGADGGAGAAGSPDPALLAVERSGPSADTLAAAELLAARRAARPANP